MTEKIVAINGNIFFSVRWDHVSRRWIGHCEALGMVLEGETWADLQETIDDSLQLFFRELVSTGDFTRFLRDRNWTPVGELPDPANGRIRFDLPWVTVPEARHGPPAAVP